MKTSARSPKARALRLALLGVAGFVVLALVLQPWWLAPVVSHRLSASSGRAVHIDSMWMSVSSSFAPVAQLRGIRIDNAPWAASQKPFAALAAATAIFSWRSIEERRPVVALMVLRDGEVDLERRSDGLRNWRLTKPDDRGPGQVKVLAIQGEQATLRFLHGPLELDFEARSMPNRRADAAAAGEPMPTWIDARGTWRGVPFVVGAATAQVLTLLETDRSFRLRGRVETGGARLDLDGHAGDIVRWPVVRGHVAAVVPDLGKLVESFDVHGGAAGRPLRAEGTLQGDSSGYTFSALRARFGATDLAGDVHWTRGDERDRLRVALTSESADLADLRALARRKVARSARKAAGATAVPAAASAATTAASVPARSAHPLDVELHFAAKRLRGAELPSLQGASVEAALVDGRLQVSRFDVALGQGRVAGKATVELAATPMHGEAEVDVSAMRLESLLGEQAAKSQLSGLLRGRAALKASGESLEALVASAAGTVSAFVSAGTISSLVDAKMGLQGGRIVRSMLTGAEPIAIRCAVAVVDIRKGEGRIRTLVVDTERTRTTGTGTIDLARRTLDVVLTPEAKQPGLFVIDRSIHLQGALREPRHELVARAAPSEAAAPGCRPERP